MRCGGWEDVFASYAWAKIPKAHSCPWCNSAQYKVQAAAQNMHLAQALTVTCWQDHPNREQIARADEANVKAVP